jgi:dTDP-4-dehydrorhamnose reductase
MGNILVFGASGQLGQCIKAVSTNQEVPNVVFPNESEANILDLEALRLLFEQYQPSYCINCAAYTAVDKAEDDADIARKINKDGAANLALLSKEFGAVLIHISTDFVFEGNKPHFLSETDKANPINVYGLTKLEGEKAIASITDKYFIIRTSWLYSEYGNNFVKTMIRLGTEKDDLSIIADQIGTPTYGIDLAKAVFAIIKADSNQFGVYHYSNEGVTSWYDFAKAIFDIAAINVNAYPVRTSGYVTRAVRPAFSVMDKSKIKTTFDLEIPYWRDSLTNCINTLKAQ